MHRNSAVRIPDRPELTLAVFRERKTTEEVANIHNQNYCTTIAKIHNNYRLFIPCVGEERFSFFLNFIHSNNDYNNYISRFLSTMFPRNLCKLVAVDIFGGVLYCSVIFPARCLG